MGLLDALFSGDAGTGLLGGLPATWQYQNPADDPSKKDREFLAALQQDPSVGNNLVAPQSPFGPVPQMAAPPQPQSPFTGGAAPIMGAPSGPAMFAQPQPGAQPPQAPAPAPAPVPMQPGPQVAPQQAGPINTMNIGGYKMPQMGTVADYTPDDSATPPNARPTQGQLPAGPATPPSFLQPPSSGGFGAAGRGALANMQGGPLGMIAGAIAGGMGMGQGTEADVKRQNLKAQYDALIGAGMTPQKAMLSILNPEAGKTLIDQTLSNKQKWGEIGSDAFGNKTMGWIDETNQTINGKPMGEGGGAGGDGAVGGLLAPGVKTVDSSLSGKDYLEQFSPEVKAAVQNYVDGKSTPTGNPRKGFTQAVKMIAQKYGADTGQSVDDASYAARRTMRNQLSSSAPSSLGGQINIGNTAAGHLADLSQKALELGNVDTGIAPLSAAVNSVRGLGTEQAAKMEALKGAAQHYGQEITKFYAGSPGGTAERDRFIESVNGARSPKELAAILSTEGELMRSRLDALGGQIKGVLGEEGAAQYPVLRADGQAALSKVEANVARLKGGAAPAASGKPPVVTQNGHTYTLQADGSYK